MSKLTQVRTALKSNQLLTMVVEVEKNYLSDKRGYFCHTVDFYVAVNTQGVYTAAELQRLMLLLIPDLEPSAKDDFRESNVELEFGKLYFDEEIGARRVQQTTSLTLEDMPYPAGFLNGKKSSDVTEKLERRIWVRLFPNSQIAHEAIKGINQHSISKMELAKSQETAAQLASSAS